MMRSDERDGEGTTLGDGNESDERRPVCEGWSAVVGVIGVTVVVCVAARGGVVDFACDVVGVTCVLLPFDLTTRMGARACVIWPNMAPMGCAAGSSDA